MKCLKNVKTGNIIRVDDKQANQMAGNQWKYVPKEEWRGVKKVEESPVVTHDMGGSYEVKKNKKK
jgi:hypothetical protein